MGPQFFVDGGFVCTYKGITRLLGRGSVRITPARAGKRPAATSSRMPNRDHPRTRGEKTSWGKWGCRCEGSPPHTRGKGKVHRGGDGLVGITPAHAGKRLHPYGPYAWPGDHPRTRGEKLVPLALGLGFQGSPPHTRGKGQSAGQAVLVVGITPAHAGKSYETLAGRVPTKGSPPHTRGKD